MNIISVQAALWILFDTLESVVTGCGHTSQTSWINSQLFEIKKWKSLNFIFGIKMDPLSEQEMKKWRAVAGLDIILGAIVAIVQVQ